MPLGHPERVLVVLVDGLGAQALAARSGHARTLSAALGKRSRIATGCPDDDRGGADDARDRHGSRAARHRRLRRARSRPGPGGEPAARVRRRRAAGRLAALADPVRAGRRRRRAGVRDGAAPLRRLRLHRGGAPRRRVPRGADDRAPLRRRVRRLRRAAAGRSATATCPSSTRSPTARAGPPGHGRTSWRPSTRSSGPPRPVCAPASGCSSPPITGWSTCRRRSRCSSTRSPGSSIRCGTSRGSRACCSCTSRTARTRRPSPSAGAPRSGASPTCGRGPRRSTRAGSASVDPAVEPRIGDVLVAARSRGGLLRRPQRRGPRHGRPARGVDRRGAPRAPADVLRGSVLVPAEDDLVPARHGGAAPTGP